MLTKQGVRDLNGPQMNGRHYNGRRDVSCPHYRIADFPTYRTEEVRQLKDAIGELVSTVNVYRCTNCGEERWNELNETEGM